MDGSIVVAVVVQVAAQVVVQVAAQVGAQVGVQVAVQVAAQVAAQVGVQVGAQVGVVLVGAPGVELCTAELRLAAHAIFIRLAAVPYNLNFTLHNYKSK